MSSSSAAEDKKFTGKVLLGGTESPAEETTIQDLEGKKRPTWDSSTDEEYIGRVKEKAQAFAKDIISKAISEAEQIKETARQEGYQEGVAQGGEAVNQQINEFGQMLGQALTNIQEQGKIIWAEQRVDIIALIRLAVEKALLVEMDSQREAMLAGLLDEALERIDSKRMLTIRVHPESQEIMQVLLSQAQAQHPDLGRWKIKQDPSLELGGVIVESDEGMVDNTLPSRWQGIESVFDQLSATAGEAEEQAPQQEAYQDAPQYEAPQEPGQPVPDVPVPE